MTVTSCITVIQYNCSNQHDFAKINERSNRVGHKSNTIHQWSSPTLGPKSYFTLTQSSFAMFLFTLGELGLVIMFLVAIPNDFIVLVACKPIGSLNDNAIYLNMKQDI